MSDREALALRNALMILWGTVTICRWAWAGWRWSRRQPRAK